MGEMITKRPLVSALLDKNAFTRALNFWNNSVFLPNIWLEEHNVHQETINGEVSNKQCPGTKISAFTNKGLNIAQKASKPLVNSLTINSSTINAALQLYVHNIPLSHY